MAEPTVPKRCCDIAIRSLDATLWNNGTPIPTARNNAAAVAKKSGKRIERAVPRSSAATE